MAYTFIYSKRSGTPAATMDEQVPEEVKRVRLQQLMDKKIEAIEKSQDVKSEAIKLTTSMQLAVSLAIAEYANPKSLDTLETLITKYRKFILENWEVDITDTQPF